MKLTTTLSTSNMYLFNKNETLTKYENANAILNDFIETRMEYYETRKQSQLKHLQGLLMLYSNKYRFITELLDNVLDLRKKKASVIETMLIERKYDHLEEKEAYN